MPRQLLRLKESRKSDDFDDQQSPGNIQNSEVIALNSQEFLKYLLSQVKRIIHGDRLGRWKDNPANIMGHDISLESLFDSIGGHEPLIADFSWTDFVAGRVSLGVCPAERVIPEVALCIFTAFDGGAQLTVGDVAAQGRLMTAAENSPDNVALYKKDVDYEYAAETEIFIFFPAGTPTTGSGRIIAYLE